MSLVSSLRLGVDLEYYYCFRLVCCCRAEAKQPIIIWLLLRTEHTSATVSFTLIFERRNGPAESTAPLSCVSSPPCYFSKFIILVAQPLVVLLLQPHRDNFAHTELDNHNKRGARDGEQRSLLIRASHLPRHQRGLALRQEMTLSDDNDNQRYIEVE